MIDVNQLRQLKSMADALSAYVTDLIGEMSHPDDAPPASKPETLDVIYRSQWDADGDDYNSDCGPASVAMVIEFLGSHVPINQVAQAANQPAHPTYTIPGDLIHAAAKYGVTLRRVLGLTIEMLRDQTMVQRLPVIALVHYGTLTPLVQDKRFTGGHWLVVVGVDEKNVYVHDPNWRGDKRNDGARLAIPNDVFAQALADCRKDGNTPNQGMFVVKS